jgi:predicted transcriptional regulator
MEKPAKDNVVELRPAAKPNKRSFEAKWGKTVAVQGFCMIPALLLRAQQRLGLSPTQLAVIIQLCDFWWDDDNVPWPKKETIAHRLNLSEKQVQRVVRDLENRGYVQRMVRTTWHGRTSNGYDLSGLVNKLKELAPEFAEAAQAKRKVERRGGLKVAGAKGK